MKSALKSAQKGFTLIELMIVVASLAFWRLSPYLLTKIILCAQKYLR